MGILARLINAIGMDSSSGIDDSEETEKLTYLYLKDKYEEKPVKNDSTDVKVVNNDDSTNANEKVVVKPVVPVVKSMEQNKKTREMEINEAKTEKELERVLRKYSML
jgi:hypothetical protein